MARVVIKGGKKRIVTASPLEQLTGIETVKDDDED
jgi:hypothetical protein